MPLPSLTQLDPERVEQASQELNNWLTEANPSLELSWGPLRTWLQYYSAAITAALEEVQERIARSDSLLEIEADPELADETTVDQVLSNFGVTRTSAVSASGQITLVFEDDTTVFIAAGARFEANGQQYRTLKAFVAKAQEAQVVSDTDRLLTPLSDGTYACTIEVEAVDPGEAGTLRRGTAVVPVTPPPGFVRGYAASDFTPGRNASTTPALLARLQEGIAAKSLGGSVNLVAALREAFPDIAAASVIGCGSPEMTRDAHTIWPMSLGGKVDVYLRTEPILHRFGLTKQATLLSVDGTVGTWQLSISRDDAPGFYEIVAVRPVGSAITTLNITSETRGMDLTGDGFVPDIVTQQEAAYTAFQTAVIQFTDDRADYEALAPGDTAQYEVELTGQPYIGEIQKYTSAAETRSRASDVLVKAAVPCFVELSFTIYRPAGTSDVDTEAIKTALVSVVNNLGFTGALPASLLHDTIHGFLSAGQYVGPIDMLGRIRRPDGTLTYNRTSDTLEVPDEPLRGVTPQTVQFYLEADDIAVTVRSAGASAV